MDMPIDPESLKIFLAWLDPLKWVVGAVMLIVAIGWAMGKARNRRP
jgi:hypothetical protein